ncbi:MAG: hypothetical protein ACLFN8_05325 [Candidatus Woesearchaeota archaeon]
MKKGQITIFVIIGFIVFLLVLLAFYYLRLEPEELPETNYDSRLQPITSEINSCLNTLAKEAFTEIGLSGGKLNTQNTRYDLFPEYLNTGIELFEDSEIIVPYWIYYEGDPWCTDCNMIINIPQLEGTNSNTVASQVEQYIENNIQNCMNDFMHYSDYNVLAGVPNAKITFREEDVAIRLEYPLNVTFHEGAEGYLSTFSNVLDIKFKQTYELARTMALQMQFLDEQPFLDKSMTSILTLMSMPGKDADIPPILAETEQGTHSNKMWLKTQTKNILQDVIQETIPHFQVTGSKDSFIPITDSPYLNQIYTDFQFKLENMPNEVLSNKKIRFNYFKDWSLYLNIFPSRGELIMPTKQSAAHRIPLMGDIGTTTYEFSYDMVVPILITIEEEESYGGEGYYFQFALTSNLQGNRPRSPEFNGTRFDPADYEDYESGFAALDQRTVPINLMILNAYTSETIRNVPLYYSCGDYGMYLEPITNEDEHSLKTKIPPCIGGTLSLDDHRYLLEPITDDFLVGAGEKQILAELYPAKELALELTTLVAKPSRYLFNYSQLENHPEELTEEELENAVFDPENAYHHHEDFPHLFGVPNYPRLPKPDTTRDWILPQVEAGQGNMPDNDETILITMQRIKNHPLEPEFFEIVSIENPREEHKINLVPGDYDVIVFSSMKIPNNLTIRNQTYEVEGETIIFDEIQFNETIIRGFMELKEENTLKISKQEIQTTNELQLVYPTYDVSQLLFHQDLEVLEIVMNASNTHPHIFRYYLR